MKSILLIVVALLFLSCKNETGDTTNFSWLSGSWSRVEEAGENKTYEKWIPTINGNYNGHGFTLHKKDTVFEEFLSIKPLSKLSKGKESSWVLIVTGVNEEPTIFNIEDTTVNSFTAVNLENEFPTHIRYSYKNDTLKALVSNDSLHIDFKFIKQ
ncbi:DUF6265 family protein [Nonlabens sp. Asnod3-A02]|uniref:DUF6265 family protein n=1 Tax=Nonlabens sp. Asnod3-A02 TaxID=3160579 RepID=UPI0038692A7D